MRRSRAAVPPALLLTMLLASLGPAALAAPAEFDRAAARADLLVLDAAFGGAGRTGDAWSRAGFCATSEALDRYLEGRYRERIRRLEVSGPSDGASATDAASAATSGGVRLQDGIWIVESDGTILANDDPQDLLGQSLRFTPVAGGYDVTFEALQYDSNVGQLVLPGASSRTWLQAGLSQFPFPMGGNSYSTIYIGTDISVRMNNPTGVPVYNGDEYTLTSAVADLFTDRVDRFAPLFFARGNNWGRFIYYRATPQRVLITWRTNLSPTFETFYVDVQAALFPDGTILFSYKTLQNVDNGAPFVYERIQSWIDGFVPLGTAADPVDDSSALDVVSISAAEAAGTDVLHVRSTMASPLPGSHPDLTGYTLVLSQGGSPVYRLYTWINKGGRGSLWVFTESTQSWARDGRPSFDGTHWDVYLSLAQLPDLSAGPVEVRIETDIEGTPVDDATLSVVVSGGAAFETDYTAQAPLTVTRPTIEAFHYPELMTRGVREKLFAHTGWVDADIDAVPIYQTFYTDLVLWAGGYYSYGNCAAANVGLCDPAEPYRPGLLHMNKTYEGFNFPTIPDRFTVLSHEFGHHWLQSIEIDEGAGPTDVLNPISAHPAAHNVTEARSDLVNPEDSSVMGGGFWRDNGDGTFSTPPFNTYFSYAAYELYLMGLMDPVDVTDWAYLENTNPPQPLAYWPSPATTVTATRRTVTMQMLLDAMGPRLPSYPATRQDFFTPMVLIVRPGETPSVEDWDYMMSIRDPWRAAFRTQTDDRGTVTTISPREVSPPGSPPLRAEPAGSDLRFFFEDPGFSDQVSWNVYEGLLDGSFDDWSPLDCGRTATDAGGGELTLDATPLLPGNSSYYLVTMSNVVFEGTPGSAADGTERQTMAARCGGQ